MDVEESRIAARMFHKSIRMAGVSIWFGELEYQD